MLKHRDVFMVVVIVVPAGAKVSRLPSLKEPLENKFSRGSNSHRLLVTITPTIESLCFFICPRSFCALYEILPKEGEHSCCVLTSVILREKNCNARKSVKLRSVKTNKKTEVKF